MPTIYNAVSHASNRRPIALRDEDYDHEIRLIDQTTLSHTGSRSVDIPRSDDDSIARETTQTTQTTQTTLSRRHSFDHGRHSSKIKNGIEHKRWSKKWTEERAGERAGQPITDWERSLEVTPTTSTKVRATVTDNEDSENSRGRSTQKLDIPTMTLDRCPTIAAPESAIDILYENQRGGFLCGQALFGSRALGMFDAAPWTNIAFKPSASNIKNAQVPDPGWEWAWPDWIVNHDPDNESLDDEGWEYSFMFSHHFSWHGPNWYNSFVRRRAWIRKRVRVNHDVTVEDPYRLAAEYFTVNSDRPHSASNSNSVSRISSRREIAHGEVGAEVRDVEQLLAAMKECRIDREKSEIVEAFVKGADEGLGEFAGKVSEVMAMFIFQASRRTLLVHLNAALDETSAEQKEAEDKGEVGTEQETGRKKRIDHLLKAVGAAGEEVKRMEYWSDIKGVTKEGLAKGAVDQEQGWDQTWTGLDTSAPRDVITEAKLPGVKGGAAMRAEGSTDIRPSSQERKGKGKENEM